MSHFYDTSKVFREEKNSGTDLVVSLVVHIYHDIGTHLGSILHDRKQLDFQQNLFLGSTFLGSKFCVMEHNAPYGYVFRP